MSDTIIRVENLGKKYMIGHQQPERYVALRDVMANGVKSLGRRLLQRKPKPNPAREEFWALKDVSFEVKRGDRVGIIGRNGAGKSTLLKVLSRITEPTTGRISLKGRVASLLEVGTGFHPELTGRENIFLNGAVLGMGKAEIRKKFDQIVAFAEVERFLDTPVKRYSSGMYVRLAFAVAAHLEPEILVVDEVLAVGDAAFQRKCLGKMEDVAEQEGRTVLFVSHNMAAVENLCSRAILLNLGRINFTGDTKTTIEFYSKSLETQGSLISISDLKRSGTGEIQITSFHLEDCDGSRLYSVTCGEDLILVFQYQSMTEKSIRDVNIGFSIHNRFGDMLSILYSEYVGTTFSCLPSSGRFKCKMKDFPFSPGKYSVKVRVTVKGIESDWIRDPVGIIIVDSEKFYKSAINTNNLYFGPLLIRGNWELESSQKSIK